MAKNSVYVFTENVANKKTKFYSWGDCSAYMKKHKGISRGFVTEKEADDFINGVNVKTEKKGQNKSKNEVCYAFKAIEDKYSKIFDTWDEVLQYKKEHKGEGKKFKSRKEAEEYLNLQDPLYHKEANNYPKDGLNCYVDGSFSAEVNNYSFGLVCEKDGKVLHYDKGLGNNEEAVSMQQIGGELLGAIKALLYAKKENIKKVVIFFDYKGVCYHALGYWKLKNDFSKVYYEWMQNFFKENPEIDVYFCKVDAHTGDDFNEIADNLAKSALGIKVEKKFIELCKEYGVEL